MSGDKQYLVFIALCVALITFGVFAVTAPDVQFRALSLIPFFGFSVAIVWVLQAEATR